MQENTANGLQGSNINGGISYGQNDLNCLWVRIGSIDGLKYLSKHFQIVIINRDTCYEDFNHKYS